MPFVTFTVRRGLSAADKSRLSEVMLEAQVAAGYDRADRFHRFLEVERDDLLVDPRFPDYPTDRTDRFMVVEVVISSGRPTGTAAAIADEAVRLFGERLHLAPQDILFVFQEVEPNLPRFPAASIGREPTGCLSRQARPARGGNERALGEALTLPDRDLRAASATLDPATQRRAVCVVAIPAHLSRLFALLHVPRPFRCSPFPRPDPPRWSVREYGVMA
jgi:hypothetical protein